MQWRREGLWRRGQTFILPPPSLAPEVRSQPTRECGELLACVGDGAPAEIEFGAFSTPQNISGGRISRTIKYLNDRKQTDKFFVIFREMPPPEKYRPGRMLPLAGPRARLPPSLWCFIYLRMYNKASEWVESGTSSEIRRVVPTVLNSFLLSFSSVSTDVTNAL